MGARLLGALLAVKRMQGPHRAADALTELEELTTKRGVPKDLPPVVVIVDQAHDPAVVHGVLVGFATALGAPLHLGCLRRPAFP